MRIVAATYNVHRCVGMDGRHDPARVAAVIRELGADVVGLQEVDCCRRVADLDQLAYLAQATEMVAIEGPTLRRHDGNYGNALLTRRPVRRVSLLDLSVPRREPRGAIDAEVEVEDEVCRVVVTHLGLRSAERRLQLVQLVAACIGDPGPQPTILLGDLNEWLGAGRVLRRLLPAGFMWRSAASYPAWFPVLALDGILARPGAALATVRAHASAAARRASDHLPVRGEVHVASAPTHLRASL